MNKRIPSFDEYVNESEKVSSELYTAIANNKVKGYKCLKGKILPGGERVYDIYKGTEKIGTMMPNQFDEITIYADIDKIEDLKNSLK